MMPDLQHLSVLVAEDEYLIANDIQVAVLDINLNGEMIFPVADELARRSIPVIFFSGYDSLKVPDRFRAATRLSKCAAPSDLVSAVFEEYLQNLSTLAPMCAGLSDQSVTELLPGLRLRARLLMPSVEAADALVERTLARAILLVANRSRGQSLDTWLHDLLVTIHGESPYGLN